MHILRFYVPNSFDNYNHLLLCPDSQQALVVDPFDAGLTEHWLQEADAMLSGIVITHRHGDHVRGLADLLAKCPVPVWGHPDIPGVSHPLRDGDRIPLGKSEVRAVFTPGHTFCHFSFMGQIDEEQDFLICADTLFNAGVGNCRSGDVGLLYKSIDRLHQLLKASTLIYPAHDYLCNNLRFALTLEPDNSDMMRLLTDNEQRTPEQRTITHWGLEKTINPFLRLDNPTLLRHLALDPNTPPQPSQVFAQLRQLRDQW